MLLAFAVAFAACGEEPPEDRLANEGPEALVALAVEVEAPGEGDTTDVARAAFQTDKAGAAWYDALAAPGTDPAMGLTVGGEQALAGWRWWVDADSVGLGPLDRVRGVARPDLAVRSYMERDTLGFFSRLVGQVRGDRPARLSERITLLDGRGALLVEVADAVGVVGFRPVRSDRDAAGAFRVERVGGALAFAPVDRIPADSAAVPEGPIWTAVVATDGAVRSVEAAPAVSEDEEEERFALGEVAFETPGALVVATGPTAPAAARAARAALQRAGQLRERRTARMAAFLDDVLFDTQDETVDAAYRWAALSLDALVRRDSGRVTLAPGLPGAEPASYPTAMWSLGAFLHTGQWETARGLLTTYGDAQRFDRRIDLLGRAPDLVPAEGDPVFATADATPIFLGAAGDYVRTTGDRGLVSGGPNFWFKTVFALRGVYEPDSRNGNATDPSGFLAARGRRGTWLEGDPERGGLRRRGAPAEAQGALYQALGTATQFARIMGVSQRSSATWYADTSRVLERQFVRQFVGRDGVIADRVGDGEPVSEVRPGGLLALALLDGLPGDDRGALAQRMAERLVFPYGVASLAQTDSLFHPYLDAPAYYDPEAARTGGAVWTWLAGPVATLMAETGGAAPAAELLANQARLLLDRGVVGGIPMLVSGHPQAEDLPPAVGGAPVQPWSLAGFIRGTMEGLVGARYQSPDTLVVAPRLPEAWGATTVRLRMGEGSVALRLSGGEGGLDARVQPTGTLPEGAAIVLEAAGRRVAVPLVQDQGDTLVVAREAFEVALTAEGAVVDGEAVASVPDRTLRADWSGFAFAQPELRDEYPVMRAVAERRALGDDQILRDNPVANLAVTQTDPDGDDWGPTSTYVYPEGVPEGVLDATYLEVARDDSTTYFRAEFTSLAPDPQTIVAFAIDTEEGGTREVGRGAGYRFPEDEGYEYVVFVGDGLVAEDAAGREIGRLAPGASAFSPQTTSLQFALPTFVLPSLPRGARVTMLIGSLNPDGGVGEFRRVGEDASESEGGGRVAPQSANVYDVVVGAVR